MGSSFDADGHGCFGLVDREGEREEVDWGSPGEVVAGLKLDADLAGGV